MQTGFGQKAMSSAAKGSSAWWWGLRPINVLRARQPQKASGRLNALALDFVARSENLQCSCHAVERIPSAGRGRAAQFVPIRFVFSNKLSRHDKLLLAFDALVISKVLGREVTLGRIVYGDDHVALNVKVSALKNEVEKLTDKIGVLISSPSPPDLILNRHCAECEFQTRCRQKAIDKDDLSLLGSMTERVARFPSPIREQARPS